MDDFAICALALAGWCWFANIKTKQREKQKVYIQQNSQGEFIPERNIGTLAAEHTYEQARAFEWAITITRLGIARFDFNFAWDRKQHTDIETLTLATTVLLNKLRDEHPDPFVADKAAELILQLGTYAHTIE